MCETLWPRGLASGTRRQHTQTVPRAPQQRWAEQGGCERPPRGETLTHHRRHVSATFNARLPSRTGPTVTPEGRARGPPPPSPTTRAQGSMATPQAASRKRAQHCRAETRPRRSAHRTPSGAGPPPSPPLAPKGASPLLQPHLPGLGPRPQTAGMRQKDPLRCRTGPPPPESRALQLPGRPARPPAPSGARAPSSRGRFPALYGELFTVRGPRLRPDKTRESVSGGGSHCTWRPPPPACKPDARVGHNSFKNKQ